MQVCITRRGLKGTALAVGLAIFLMPSTPSQAADCVSAPEASALEVRLVQTELMVAALTCKQRPDYNRFVRQFEQQLVTRGKALRALFKRLHGRTARKHLDGFVTRLANEASMRSQRNDYCDDTASLFNDILNLKPSDLGGFAATLPFTGEHGLPVCSDRAQISRTH